ncbi:MAG: magnesium/cobalt transporter CorA [Planctomycetes bacterium]|nr:magnesium/cobalt transporter CorA [Planctomycetota bacterium]
MARRRRHHGLPTNPGRSPGTLVIPDGASAPRVRLVRYDARRLEVREGLSAADVLAIPHADEITWLAVEGFGEREMLTAIETRFDVPRLALEDVLGNCARPKLESFGDALFVVARAAKDPARVEFEQLSVFVRGRVLITFTDEPLETLSPLRKRLDDVTSLTRRSGVDFLLYRVLDSAVDTYVPALEHLGARLDAVEAEAIAHPSSKPLTTLYELMRDLRHVARVALPMRELAGALSHEARGFFHASTLPFLADLRDHTQGVVELTAHYRDLGTDVRELIHGALNLRMNQVMRLLTAVTSVFIPLSFLTGLYGMNFDHMPELHWRYGYFIVLAVLAGVALLILRWLRRQGWTKVGEE